MIITRTPFRMSFVGGGSDLKEFYHLYPGAILSTTINKYVYISSHYFFDEDKIRVKYSKTETVQNVGDLEHPILREVLTRFDIRGALEVSSNADIPAGTGLGSSSSFTVGLLHNLHTVIGEYAGKKKLAEEACEIEIERLGEPIGKQDQYAAAYGGLNLIRFQRNGTVQVDRIHLKKDIFKALEESLLLFYMGAPRKASTILNEQKQNMASSEKANCVRRMVDLVDEGRNALYAGDLIAFGEILHRNWELKTGLASGISSHEIEEIYNHARANGAIGGKLLGAGGGGFFLFLCPLADQQRLREALAPLREMRFRLEEDGSKVVYVGDEYEKR